MPVYTDFKDIGSVNPYDDIFAHRYYGYYIVTNTQII